MLTICSIGCFTSLFGSIMAMFQSHMKRIIAYSTTSQLGYMMFSCALGNYFGIVFHLFIHAFFKSLLFLTSMILANNKELWVYKLGGYTTSIPLSYNFILISLLSLTAWPIFSGYFSKEYILSSAIWISSDLFLYYISNIAIHLTVYYSSKLIISQFWIVAGSTSITYLFLILAGNIGCVNIA